MEKLLKLVNEKLFFWGIAFLLFFIPLYPKFPLFGISGTYVHIRLEDFLVSALLGLFVVWLIVKKDFSLLKDSLARLLILYFAVGLISIVSAVFLTKNITPHLAFLHFLRRVEYISLLFIAYYSFKNIKQLRIFAIVTGIAVVGVVIYALGQKFLGWPVVSTMNKEFSRGMILKLTWWARVNSTFAGHYDLAAFMVMIIPLAISAFMITKKWLKRTLLLVLGVMAYYILLLTASRVSFVAFLISSVFVLWFARRRLWIIPFLAISLLGMFFSDDLGQRYAATFKVDLSFLSFQIKLPERSQPTPIPALTPTPTPVPIAKVTPPPSIEVVPTATPTPTPTPEPVATGSGEPIETTVMAVGRSTDIRLKVEWPRALRAFAKNPLLGTGYSSIDLATDNDYLRMLGEIGLLGLFAFLAVILEIGRRIILFWRKPSVSREERMIVLGIVAASLGYFLNAVFIDVFEASKIAFFFWILMGIALKVIDLNREKSLPK
jgi:hypothetical protein